MTAISRTFDAELIKGCVTHPKLWHWLSDDGSDIETYQPVIHESIYWLRADSDEFLGVFMAHPHNSICYEIHTILLPSAWGKSVELGKSVIEWMFTHTPCRKLITNVPSSNKLAKRLALLSGMVHEGINTASFLKNDVLFDQHVYGIRKDMICQQ